MEWLYQYPLKYISRQDFILYKMKHFHIIKEIINPEVVTAINVYDSANSLKIHKSKVNRTKRRNRHIHN